ncbi:MAG: preprotein translocase subunit SecE [Betaproteobacteria bacterium]|nr:preprotein translocase subunit SecE [Betaproteobacteria bacterium]
MGKRPIFDTHHFADFKQNLRTGFFNALLNLGQQFLRFTKEAWSETRRVVWPDRKETVQMTLTVFGFVVIAALFLWIVDKSLEWILYGLILGWKS